MQWSVWAVFGKKTLNIVLSYTNALSSFLLATPFVSGSWLTSKYSYFSAHCATILIVMNLVWVRKLQRKICKMIVFASVIFVVDFPHPFYSGHELGTAFVCVYDMWVYVCSVSVCVCVYMQWVCVHMVVWCVCVCVCVCVCMHVCTVYMVVCVRAHACPTQAVTRQWQRSRVDRPPTSMSVVALPVDYYVHHLKCVCMLPLHRPWQDSDSIALWMDLPTVSPHPACPRFVVLPQFGVLMPLWCSCCFFPIKPCLSLHEKHFYVVNIEPAWCRCVDLWSYCLLMSAVLIYSVDGYNVCVCLVLLRALTLYFLTAWMERRSFGYV